MTIETELKPVSLDSLTPEAQAALFEKPIRFYPEITHPATLVGKPKDSQEPQNTTTEAHPATLVDKNPHPETVVDVKIRLRRNTASSGLNLQYHSSELLASFCTAVEKAKQKFSDSPEHSPVLGPSDHARANRLLAELCKILDSSTDSNNDAFDFPALPAPLLLPNRQLSSPKKMVNHQRRCSMDASAPLGPLGPLGSPILSPRRPLGSKVT